MKGIVIFALFQIQNGQFYRPMGSDGILINRTIAIDSPQSSNHSGAANQNLAGTMLAQKFPDVLRDLSGVLL
jgi:hypothetical protein